MIVVLVSTLVVEHLEVQDKGEEEEEEVLAGSMAAVVVSRGVGKVVGMVDIMVE